MEIIINCSSGMLYGRTYTLPCQLHLSKTTVSQSNVPCVGVTYNNRTSEYIFTPYLCFCRLELQRTMTTAMDTITITPVPEAVAVAQVQVISGAAVEEAAAAPSMSVVVQEVVEEAAAAAVLPSPSVAGLPEAVLSPREAVLSLLEAALSLREDLPPLEADRPAPAPEQADPSPPEPTWASKARATTKIYSRRRTSTTTATWTSTAPTQITTTKRANCSPLRSRITTDR